MSNSPSNIYILRHAEKTSDPSDEKLSTKGRERAAALAHYLPSLIGEIDYIFAAGHGEHSPSHRPVETVEPLASRLSLSVNHTYLKDKHSELVTHILRDASYHDKGLVICWEHSFIADICSSFDTSNIPTDPWPSSRFDLVWRLNRQHDAPFELEQIPQLLMYGDQTSILE